MGVDRNFVKNSAETPPAFIGSLRMTRSAAWMACDGNVQELGDHKPRPKCDAEDPGACNHVRNNEQRAWKERMAADQESAGPFERFATEDVRDLVAEYPLAWVTAGDAASLLPLIGTYDDAGKLSRLIGHLARANPLCSAMHRSGEARILFQGPNAYISPEHAGRRDWAPTWNYAQLVIHAQIRFEGDRTGEALDLLIDAMERERAFPWGTREMGARYERLLPAIIGFQARVTNLEGRFKLGQDEALDTLSAILTHHPDAALQRWMRRMNAARIGFDDVR